MDKMELKIINQEAPIIAALFGIKQDEFEKITNKELEKMALPKNMLDMLTSHVYIVGEVNENNFSLIEACASSSALFYGDPIKEVFVFPTKHFMISVRTFNATIDMAKEKELKIEIDYENVRKSIIKNNFLDLLKEPISLGKIHNFTDEQGLYVLVGKASKALWDSIALISSPLTTKRELNLPNDKISGIVLLNENGIEALKIIYNSTEAGFVKEDLANIFKEQE